MLLVVKDPLKLSPSQTGNTLKKSLSMCLKRATLLLAVDYGISFGAKLSSLG